MPALAREGLTAHRLALLARRLRRAEAAIEMAVDRAVEMLSAPPWPERGSIVLSGEKFARLPAEVALRLLGRAIVHAGDEGPVELGKLEALQNALAGCECESETSFAAHLGGSARGPRRGQAGDRACPGAQKPHTHALSRGQMGRRRQPGHGWKGKRNRRFPWQGPPGT